MTDIPRGPATALEEDELQRLTFHWSWKQTAQQLVGGLSTASSAQVGDSLNLIFV